MPFFRQFIVFLMIAVLFNTAIGVPLHAAEHLKGSAATPAAGSATRATRVFTRAMVEAGLYGHSDVAQAGIVAPAETPSESGGDTAAELCAVCAAYGQSMADFVIWPAAPPVGRTSSRIIAFDAPPPGEAVQWSYSARDPPRA